MKCSARTRALTKPGDSRVHREVAVGHVVQDRRVVIITVPDARRPDLPTGELRIELHLIPVTGRRESAPEEVPVVSLANQVSLYLRDRDGYGAARVGVLDGIADEVGECFGECPFVTKDLLGVLVDG